MPITKLPKIGLFSDLTPGSSGWATQRNYNSNRSEQLISPSILGQVANPGALPGSPADGDMYFVQSTNNLSIWILGAWFTDYAPLGFIVYDSTLNAFYYFDGAGLVPVPGTGTGDVVGPVSAVDNNIAVYDGVTGKLIKDGGISVASVVGNSVTQSAITKFTSSGTWTKSTLNPKFIRVTVIGGGGGGGGVNNTPLPGETTVSGGGGGGGCSIKTIMAASLGATETVTVGANGNGGSTGGGNGTSGGTTSFGAHCQATGGGGGAGETTPTAADTRNVGGTGGVGSGGDVNFRGSDGGDGSSAQGRKSQVGSGGGTYLAGFRTAITNATGNAGYTYGGGGSGTADTGNNTGRAGGAGADGIVIVEEFY